MDRPRGRVRQQPGVPRVAQTARQHPQTPFRGKKPKMHLMPGVHLWESCRNPAGNPQWRYASLKVFEMWGKIKDTDEVASQRSDNGKVHKVYREKSGTYVHTVTSLSEDDTAVKLTYELTVVTMPVPRICDPVQQPASPTMEKKHE